MGQKRYSRSLKQCVSFRKYGTTSFLSHLFSIILFYCHRSFHFLLPLTGFKSTNKRKPASRNARILQEKFPVSQPDHKGEEDQSWRARWNEFFTFAKHAENHVARIDREQSKQTALCTRLLPARPGRFVAEDTV